MNLDFPFHVDGRRRTAATDDNEHIRHLIEQVLFTAPGERVNRPTLGCGLMRLIFAPNSPELAAATQFLVHGALQQWLADVIQVEDVALEAQDSALVVSVVYIVRRTEERRTSTFTRKGAP